MARPQRLLLSPAPALLAATLAALLACGGSDATIANLPTRTAFATRNLTGTWVVTTALDSLRNLDSCATQPTPAVTLWITQSPADSLQGGELVVDSRWRAGPLAGPLHGGINQTTGDATFLLFADSSQRAAVLLGAIDTGRVFKGTLADHPAADSLDLLGIGTCPLTARATRTDTSQTPTP